MFIALRALQQAMPWTDLWSESFIKDPRSYKKLEHCLINIVAKSGGMLQRVEMADHYGEDYALALDREKDGQALAFIVMSALKAANTYPGGPIDVAALVEQDMKRRLTE